MTSEGSGGTTPLASVRVSLLRGALAHDGVLEVTPNELRFRPTGMLDQQMGVRSIVLQRASLTRVSLSPDAAFLSVRQGATTHRFAGAGLDAVCRSLDAGDLQARPPLIPGREVVLEGIVDFQVSGGAWRLGHFTLRRGRLDVVPLDRQRGGSASADLVVPLADLTTAELDKAQVLQLSAPGLTLRLRGAATGALRDRFAQLRKGQPVSALADPALLSVPAGWWRGPVVHWGSVTLSAQMLRFEPTGLLDTLVGVRPFTLPWTELRGLELSGTGEQRTLVLRGVSGRFQIELAAGAVVHLTRLWHHAQARAALDAQASNRWARGLLEGWSHRVPALHEAPLLTAPGLLASEGDIVSGLLVLTGPAAVFLPEELGGAARPTVWAVERMNRAYAVDPDVAHCLRFESDRGPVRILQALGEPFLQAFWARCRAPSRIVDWPDLSTRTRSRLTGKADFVAITVGTDRVVMRPATTFEHPRGWAVVATGRGADAPRRPSRATIEVGQTEGVYEFDARLIDVAPLPPRFRDAAPRGGCVLIFDRRGQVRVFNQREGLRVLTVVHGTLELATDALPGGRVRIRCSVVDLSIGGCRVQAASDLAVGDRGRLTFTLQGRRIATEVTIVRALPGEQAEGAHYALSFAGLGRVDEDRIHRFVLEEQRRALSTAPSANEAGPEEGPGGVPDAIAP